MSDETELLPLPESDGLNDIDDEVHHYYYNDTLQAYARANVEAYAAKLRGEVVVLLARVSAALATNAAQPGETNG